MSTQEERFAQIAAAIREKDGTTAPIRALDFAERIRAIQTGGGGSDFAVPLIVTVDAGATVTATHGETTVTGTADGEGAVVLILPEPGTWTVTAALGDKEKSTEVEVGEGYSAKISLSSRLPDGYTELEYIQSESGVCFDTKVKATSTTKIEMNVDLLTNTSSSTNYLFGTRNYVSSSRVYYGFYMYRNSNQWYAAMGSTAQRITSPSINNIHVSLDAATGIATINEESISFTSPIINTSMPTIVLLGIKTTSNGASANISAATEIPAKFFSCTIFDGETKIRDFVPCVNPSGSIGLFDLVESSFYANASTGAITPGPAV